MALSDPRIIFGVHSVSPYSRTTGEFYGILRVLGGSSISLSGELIKLNGGSNKYPWAIEDGLITAEMSLKVKEYPSFLFELFLGKAPTDVTTPDTDGTVSAVTDKFGTTVVDASTGLASVIVIPTTGAADLKFGKYVLKATSDDDLNIYVSTNANFARGTDENYDDDLLLVGTVAIGDSGATTDVASLGLRFTAGSGTTAFTIGHTATFEVQPPLTKSMSVSIGSNSDVFPEFGAILMAKQRGNLELFEIDAHRCKGVGLPLGLEENAFSEAEIKVECFYDSTLDRVLSIRHCSPSS